MQRIIPMRLGELLQMLTLIAITSCESEDRRLAEYALRTTEQQARQNERMAEQSQSVARQSQELVTAAHDLVELDAMARREIIQAQDKLQQQNHAERTFLDRQREQVDSERKAAAQAAVREPIIAQSIIAGGLILAALLPLLVTVYALSRLPEQRPVDELLEDVLLQGLSNGEPISLPRDVPPPSLAESAAPRLGAPGEPPSSRVNSLGV